MQLSGNTQYISKFDWSRTVGLNKINQTKDCFVAKIKERINEQKTK